MKPTNIFLLAALTIMGCGGSKNSSTESTTRAEKPQPAPVSIAFSADSAYAFCEKQCSFGPRTMNSKSHEQCGQWIVDRFRNYGMQITEQRVPLKGFDGTSLLSNNIIASYRPDLQDRIMLCAHWDCRPWADNDPNPDNHKKPVMGANDGASGVAVMLELARLLSIDSLKVGIDFICFDAEDWGDDGQPDSWALGAQYWASHLHKTGYKPRYGILLDMVGGQQARFYQESYSRYYAPQVVDRVWRAAEIAGYSSYFPKEEGGAITDDHGPVNEVAKIPCIDIIPYYPECQESSFGPTWHTVNDDMQHIDSATLKAVGQTLVQVLFTE
ncbi:MAG: M28 family peptidase [Prevotella sp.]|nr:M28 family peptidase [Prevotella sp.]